MRTIAIVVVLAALAGCIRVIVNIGGRDVEHKQAIEVEPAFGVNVDNAKKGNREGDEK